MSITKEAAREIAREHLAEHPVAGIDGIAEVGAYGEPGFRKPAFYHPVPIDIYKCWMVYAKYGPNGPCFGGNYLILISKETGEIFYAGTDGD